MLYRPIAVFDSGLGSLSVVRELRKIVPAENIIYFADRMNFPYGKKSKDSLKHIIIKSIKFLEKYKFFFKHSVNFKQAPKFLRRFYKIPYYWSKIRIIRYSK